MKRTGKHVERGLTAAMVRQTNRAGRHADGSCLYLEVDPSGAKRWLLRLTVKGRRRDMGLGSTSLVSLAEARELALALRKVARAGGDPVAERRRSQGIPTFEEAANKVHGQRKAGWKQGRHQNQWLNALRDYAYPVFGDTTVDLVERPDILRALEPIWLTKPETARRVLQRVNIIFRWAKVYGYRPGDNPADGVTDALPRQSNKVTHFAALPFEEVPAFLRQLWASKANDVTKLAFEFLILTACRSGEIREARWEEIDLHTRTWTIPSERMKAGAEHVVPLSHRAIAILEHARQFHGGGALVFPGSTGQPLSDMAFTKRLRDMELKGRATAHGFRSSFRDWAAETTDFANEVCEAALAHTIQNQTERAYRRGDLMEKRRRLMDAWSAYCAGQVEEVRPVKVGA